MSKSSSKTSKPLKSKVKEDEVQPELRYVLRTIVGVEDGNPLYDALKRYGASSMGDLLAMGNEDIGSLSFVEDGKAVDLPRAHANLIRILQAYNLYLIKEHGVRKVNWQEGGHATPEDFCDYRVSDYNPNGTSSSGNTRAPVAPSSTGSYRNESRSLASEFRKGIKRDKAHYKVLSNEKSLCLVF